MYVLDTDICIHALRQNRVVLATLLAKKRSEVAVSVITEAELRVGAAKSNAPAKTLGFVENFLRPLTVIEFTSEDALVYAELRAKLERAGRAIGPLDMLIASQALRQDATLVTGNEREFRRVHGLRMESWLR